MINVETYSDTLIGELGTIMINLNFYCTHCKGKSIKTIALNQVIPNFNDYARALLSKQSKQLRKLEQEYALLLKKVSNAKNTNNQQKNGKIYSCIIESLIARGMTRNEADTTINKLYIRDKS